MGKEDWIRGFIIEWPKHKHWCMVSLYGFGCWKVKKNCCVEMEKT